ncbi:site-specific DNA-methyltransferase [Clostridium perfringens]|uniref:site-specific DNA-methyltransferase n=1 Tax=Clostridium perfringens TaxID=1502 RepID=UPI001ABB00D5|nr:site-specific DNA-methyltransferase [Clostridium perfringens]MBO3339713.1 site-specific DNA-methyltransferase [Clostridium perfringens]
MGTKLELTWIGKDDKSKIEPRILIENNDLSNVEMDMTTDNILIHGDNLLALKALEKKYTGKIKCIYIDPPYNTGKAFDYYDDNVEHSLWLDLMYKRLVILKRLLSSDGVLCCQIDDSEGFYLKVMLDEIFGRDNYLVTFYMQVRYTNKTLAEDSDYQKVIEQCHIYAKDKKETSLNRPTEEYSLDKFKWKIIEKESGEKIELGNKSVEIFKPNQYEIIEISPSIDGLKETWATGSLSRVKASAGEFFELYLSDRKEIDGLGCLYKVSDIGEDGLGYRYISGPKKKTAKKGKFYSGVPLKRRKELENGGSLKHVPVPNFYDFSGNFGNCRLEGGVSFKGGKKPEAMLEKILKYYTNENDFVLDSFLGSGSTIAVAHKMKRRWVGIEMGEHAYTHCKVRMDNIISGKDQTGITKITKWKGGGGYRFYELAPTLIKKDFFGEPVINSEYSPDMLAAAVALHEGYVYKPSDEIFWKQAIGTENSYLFVTTNHMDINYVIKIKETMQDEEFLLIACKSFDDKASYLFNNIKFKKIPQMVLDNCEFGKDDYNLNIICPPEYDYFDEEGKCDE